MNCCVQECYGAMFDEKQARKDLKRFRKDGADPTTRALIGELRAANVQGATLLDIGGGIGAIHHELLDAGAAAATHVDASAPYIGAARDEAGKRGHDDRVEFVLGDFVTVAASVAPADVVTLDRVICCYGDMEALVAASASRAKRLYGAVFPRERWLTRVGVRVINWFNAIRGQAFRAYLHSTDAIDAAIRRQGLTQRKALKTFLWHVVVYAKT